MILMKIKYSLILSILFIFIISMSIVSAGDVDSTDDALRGTGDNIEENNDFEEMDIGSSASDMIISQPQSNEVLGDDAGTFSELLSVINGSETTITLTKDYKMQSGDAPITISRSNIVIDGQGHIIDANSVNKIFIVSGSRVVIKNITFMNGNSNNGGAIRWTGTYGTLDNASFIKCISPFWKGSTTGEAGGGVSWKGNNGLMNNCYFDGCTAQGGAGGSVHWSGKNGVINNTVIKDTIMYNCNYGYGANNGAYAICWMGTGGKLLNTRIINPTKTGYNQRPYVVDFVKGQGWIDNLTITGEVDGYSIFVPKMPVETQIGTIDVNMPIYKYTPTITLENDVFTINTVNSGFVTYSINEDNTKTVPVDANGHFTIDYDFNPSLNYFVKITYNENTFYNLATEFFDYSKNEVSEVFGTFTELNNLISSASAGSVINLYKNYIYNPITDSALSGGITISKAITINGNNHFIDADFNPVRIFTTKAKVVLNGITFKNSRFNGAGNAVYATKAIDIFNCTFDNNWASNCFGGAVNLAGGNSNVKCCTFTNNKAKTGAAIVVGSLDNYIQYCYFKGNDKDYGGAMNYGTAISITGGKTAYINYNIFLDPRPLRQSSADYTRDNWYGSNALPDSRAAGAPSIGNYLVASLDYSRNGNVLSVGIKFLESDTGEEVDIPWSRLVSYTVGSSSVVGNSLDKVTFNNINNDNFVINAVVDNQRLTRTYGNSWYVDGSVSASGTGTQDSPFKTLKNAIDSASNGDTIYVAPNTYKGSGSNVALTINKAVSIERWGTSGEVIFDGENRYSIFTLSSNVVLSSLTFKNGKGGNGGAMIIRSNSLIFDSTFIDNAASNWGGAIDMNPGSATIVNSKFINNKAPSGGGAISTAGVDLTIINSVFTDNFGGRGGAINSGNTAAGLYVYGSTFTNNTADSYGGALIFDGKGHVSDSYFENNHVTLGGGAIYMWGFTHTISNSKFINNSVDGEGGAIIAILSEVSLTNDYFANNTASSFGGAIYKNAGNMIIYKGEFVHNQAYYDGGALYFYKELDAVYETLFKNNTVVYGGGAIHSLASDIFCVRIGLLNNVTANQNGYVDTIYLNSFIDFGNYTLVVADTSNYNGELPSSFSLYDNGWSTSIKNQGSLGICWAYSTLAIVETAIKKATGVEVDFSENNLKNLISMYSPYGNSRNPNGGGSAWDGLAYLSNSLGPLFEVSDVTGSYGFSPLLTNTYHISNIAFTSRSRDDPLVINQIKEAVIKYGGVRVGMNTGTSNGYNFYQNKTTATGHAVTLVGWDDNYPASNFPGDCPGDGAWIIKNSWGPNTGKDGYVYISYYDTAGVWGALAYIIFNDTIRYSRVYQYDYSGYSMKNSGGSESWYKNVYTSVNDEGLTAFSTYFNEITDWEVYVYVGDELKHTQSGSNIAPGYFTFNFDKIVPVAKGDEFSIVLKVGTTNFPYVTKNLNTVPCGAGVSYFSKDGSSWTDMDKSNQVACLKVFTQNLPGSLVTINPITNVTYNSDVTVNFDVENRTNVSYIVKSKEGQIICQVTDNVVGNSIVLSGLSAGNYTIYISNANTEEYIGNTKSANFAVNKAGSSITINNIASVTYGNNVNVNFAVDNATAVTYIVKNAAGVAVVANTTVTGNSIALSLDAGDYTITIANAENANFTGDVKSASFSVLKAGSSVTVPVSSVVYGSSINVALTGVNATGYAAVLLDKNGNKIRDLSVSSNKVVVDASALAVGEYSIKATTVVDDNHNSATGSAKLTVTKAGSLININNINNVVYGNDVAVNFNVVNVTSVSYVSLLFPVLLLVVIVFL